MNALLLDFGGTIDTDGVHWSDKFRDAYREAGVPVPPQEFEGVYAKAEARICSGMLAADDGMRKTLETQIALQFLELGKQRGISPFRAPSDAAHRIADICMGDVLDTVRRHTTLLQQWSSRYALAIVSNFYGNLSFVTRGLGIAEYFSAIIDSAVVGVRKPDPRIFRLALDALHCPPGEALVVGDSYDRDIVPAKSIGCETVWLRAGLRQSSRDMKKADFIISSLSGLNAILSERINHEDSA
jgi:FMN phosphatase YigB (HAD superfamily)